MSCRVVVLKWLANLTHVPQSSHQSASEAGGGAGAGPHAASGLPHLGSPAMESSFYSQVSEKEPPSLFYIGEQHRNEVAVVQDVVFGTRENVNLVLELYRQGFVSPLQHSPTIRKILNLYRDWIQRKVCIQFSRPFFVFMVFFFYFCEIVSQFFFFIRLTSFRAHAGGNALVHARASRRQRRRRI